MSQWIQVPKTPSHKGLTGHSFQRRLYIKDNISNASVDRFQRRLHMKDNISNASVDSFQRRLHMKDNVSNASVDTVSKDAFT
ncbi:hypothetical protein CHS0354_023394 [Potamilus streckersoni]|uniref:Uncharacterized protein n=1 Tax=Potamilus streckersoni TaxID=2493646 RepID=A0AAE0T4T3_9BIVA|nr:hypothetical protein CHS0354_023394 [Potamilus streckersoni]